MRFGSSTRVRGLVLLPIAGLALLGSPVTQSALPTALPPNPLDSLVKSLRGKSPAGREATLLALAKQEGQVNVYTSLTSLVTKPLQAAWSKTYPDVKLALYRGSSEDITARVLAERSAQVSGADIIETNGTNMLIFRHFKDVLVPYTASPYRAKIPQTFRFDDFTADRLEKFVVAWNTNLVSDPPRSFQALAAPSWKGKLAIEPGDVDWFAALYRYFTKTKGMSTKKVDAMFEAIAANSQIISGHTTEATLLAAGQISVIVSGHASSIEQLQAKNAPISFTPFVTPVVERPQGIGISFRLAHKAAAMLYYDWLLSPAGQTVLFQNGVQPARTGFKDPSFAANPKTIEVDVRPIVSHYESWAKKFDSIIRLGKG